jgi:hypothetical protein
VLFLLLEMLNGSAQNCNLFEERKLVTDWEFVSDVSDDRLNNFKDEQAYYHTGILADLIYSRCPGRMACNPGSETRSASTLRQETVEKTGAPQDLDQFGLKDVERVVKACLPRFF